MRRRSADKRLVGHLADQKYLAWLMNLRGFNLQEAMTYSWHGEAEVVLLRECGRPDPEHCPLCRRYFDDHRASPHLPIAINQSEKIELRRADMSASDRRWQRVQQPCPKPGCQLPAAHSGPHRISHDLDEMLRNSIASLDEREKA